MRNILLSIIIPCYNEERNIRLGALENVAHYLDKKKWDYEVVLVDDGSIDESVTLINQFLLEHTKFKLLKRPHHGKAGAVTN